MQLEAMVEQDLRREYQYKVGTTERVRVSSNVLLANEKGTLQKIRGVQRRGRNVEPVEGLDTLRGQ